MKRRIIVSALISKDDKYLFIKQNKPGGAYQNALHIPGGGLEDDEDPADGIVREVSEEVGIKIKNVTPFDFDWDVLDYKGEPTVLIFLRFTAAWASGEAKPSSDAAEILWIPKSKALKQPHNLPTLRMLKKLHF